MALVLNKPLNKKKKNKKQKNKQQTKLLFAALFLSVYLLFFFFQAFMTFGNFQGTLLKIPGHILQFFLCFLSKSKMESPNEIKALQIRIILRFIKKNTEINLNKTSKT